MREQNNPRWKVVFYRTNTGNEPVREWLTSLSAQDKKTIGEDIKTLQFGWPLGMPLARKIEPGLWEIRSNIQNGIARVFFTVKENQFVLLHAFVKKTHKTPLNELLVARKRLEHVRGEE
jgi:phage-related protein